MVMSRLLLLCLAAVFAVANKTAVATPPELSPCYNLTQADGKILMFCPDTGEVTVFDEQAATALTADLEAAGGDVDVLWVLICGILVFFMQAGFSMLEAGCVSEKNVVNILFKNLMDAGIGAIAFWLVGYGFAYGNDEDNSFIGSSNFALSRYSEANAGYVSWFFQWAFAATAATIVSGAVAERCQLTAYFVYSFVITAFVYPVVVHWVWDAEGWLSAFGTTYMMNRDAATSMGMIDFAGSGVVHMVGGFSGLCGSIAAGPRLGRFSKATSSSGEEIELKEHNKVIASLGVCILWMGWYGFNCGSTLAIIGYAELAAKVSVTTTLSAASAMVTSMAFHRIVEKRFDLLESVNGILAGLVSITAGCATTEPWAAFVIGIIGAFVYIGSSRLLERLKIDDPLDACPIHGFCGAWGVLAAGIFSEVRNIRITYNEDVPEDIASSGQLFLTQLVGVLAIFAWTMATSGLTFFLIKKTIGVSVDKETQEGGLDLSEHAMRAYDRRKSVSNFLAAANNPNVGSKTGNGNENTAPELVQLTVK